MLSDSDAELVVTSESAFACATEDSGQGTEPNHDATLLAKKLIMWRIRHRISKGAMNDLLALCYQHANDVPMLPISEHSFSTMQHELIPQLHVNEIDLPGGRVRTPQRR